MSYKFWFLSVHIYMYELVNCLTMGMMPAKANIVMLHISPSQATIPRMNLISSISMLDTTYKSCLVNYNK